MTRTRVRFLLGLLFSILVIGWAVFALDWALVWNALVEARYEWVFVGMILILLTFAVRTERWRILYWPLRLPRKSLFGALIIGQAVNYMLPARAGDFVRAYLIGEETDTSKVQALGTIALEKLWDIIMLLLWITMLGLWFPLPDWLLIPSRVLALGTTLALGGIVLLVWKQKQALDFLARFVNRLKPDLRQRLLVLAQRVIDGFASIRHVRPLLGAAVFSGLTWLLGAVTNYVIFLAFDLSLPFCSGGVLADCAPGWRRRTVITGPNWRF